MRGKSVFAACAGMALATAAVGAATAPGGGQASLTCEFAVSGWIATQLELAEARRAYRDCRRAGQSACTTEQARIQSLEQRLSLLRNYVNGYCRR